MRSVLLVPKKGDPLGLLALGPCGAVPPHVWFNSGDASWYAAKAGSIPQIGDGDALVLAWENTLTIPGMLTTMAALCAHEDAVGEQGDRPLMLGTTDDHGLDLRWECERLWTEGSAWVLNSFVLYSSEPMPQDCSPDTVRICSKLYPWPKRCPVLSAWSLAVVAEARGLGTAVLLDGGEG